MSGRRPDATKSWNFLSSFRDIGPAWVTMPGHFLQHGYLTLGTGGSPPVPNLSPHLCGARPRRMSRGCYFSLHKIHVVFQQDVV